MTSAVGPAKAQLFADLEAVVFPDRQLVQVAYGHPGTQMKDDIISVGNVLVPEREYGPMSPQRRLDETLQIAVTISCWRGVLDQQVVTERALAMLSALEAYLTDVGVADSAKLTLGHTVRRAWVTAFELTETDASMVDADDTPLLNLGRLAEIAATVSAKARI